MSGRAPRQPWNNSSNNGQRPFHSYGVNRQPHYRRQGMSPGFDGNRGAFTQGTGRQSYIRPFTPQIYPEDRANLALKEEARVYLGMERSIRMEPAGGGWGASQNMPSHVDNRSALSRERDKLEEEWRIKANRSQISSFRPFNAFSDNSFSSGSRENSVGSRSEVARDENQSIRKRNEDEGVAPSELSASTSKSVFGQFSLKRKLVSESLQIDGIPNILKKSNLKNEIRAVAPPSADPLSQKHSNQTNKNQSNQINFESEDPMFSDLADDVIIFDDAVLEDVVLEAQNPVVVEDIGDLESLVSRLTLLSIAANPEIPGFLTNGPETSLLRSKVVSPFFEIRNLPEILRRSSVQPTRWISSSRNFYSTCSDSEKVLFLLFRKFQSMKNFLDDKFSRIKNSLEKFRKADCDDFSLREAEEKKLAGQIRNFLQTVAIAAPPALNLYLMRPLILERDRVQEISHMRDVDHKRAKKGPRYQTKSQTADVIKNRPDQIYCSAWDGTSDCGQLLGYDAALLWRINRLNPELTELSTNMRFCEEHAAAILSRDFCPICLKIETFSGSDESMEGNGVYCRGPRGSERHFFHPECMSGSGEIMCPQCGNTDQRLMSGWTAAVPDWSKGKSLIEVSNATIRRAMSGQKFYHLAAFLCLDRTRETPFSTDTTVAIWAPLPGVLKTYPIKNPTKNCSNSTKKTRPGPSARRTRRTAAVANRLDSAEEMADSEESERTIQSIKTFFMPNLQHFFNENSLLAFSDVLLEKYAVSFMTLSGDCGGCFCREKCIPDRCPCMRWNGPGKHYTPDGTLVFGFDTRTEFIRECGEICGCSLNRCGNRVSQMPSKVSTQLKGLNLHVTQPVKRGQFICRIGGTLTEAVPESDDSLPSTFFLPKFGLWPDSRRSLTVRDVKGPARHFRKVKTGKSPTVIPVLVIQTPISLQLNIPRQLAVPTVAFFAAKNLPTSSILSYDEDFRSVNANGPRSVRIPKTKECREYEGIFYEGRLNA